MSKTLLKQREFFLSAEMSAGLKYKNSRIEVEVRMDRDNDVGTSFVIIVRLGILNLPFEYYKSVTRC